MSSVEMGHNTDGEAKKKQQPIKLRDGSYVFTEDLPAYVHFYGDARTKNNSNSTPNAHADNNNAAGDVEAAEPQPHSSDSLHDQPVSDENFGRRNNSRRSGGGGNKPKSGAAAAVSQPNSSASMGAASGSRGGTGGSPSQNQQQAEPTGEELMNRPDLRSNEEIYQRYLYLCNVPGAENDDRMQLHAALNRIKEHRSTLVRYAHFLLKLSPGGQMRLYVAVVLSLAVCAICIFAGSAERMDCMNKCEKEIICPYNRTNFPSLDPVRFQCEHTCNLGHWRRALFGGWLLVGFLGLVVLAILVMWSSEKLGLCNDSCDHRLTFPWQGRLCTLLASICLLLGSLFTVLKLSAESGVDWAPEQFRTGWTWITVLVFIFVAYAIMWGGYIIWMCVDCGDREAKDNSAALNEEEKRVVNPCVNVSMVTFNIICSFCPVAFLILVGVSENGNRCDDKAHCKDHATLNGWIIATPLLILFILRLFSSMLSPFVNFFVKGHSSEKRRLYATTCGMAFIYSFGVTGCVFSAMKLNTTVRDCVVGVWWNTWWWSVSPFVSFAGLAFLWSVALAFIIWVLKDEDKALSWWKASSDPLVSLIEIAQKKQPAAAVAAGAGAGGENANETGNTATGYGGVGAPLIVHSPTEQNDGQHAM